MPMDDELAHLRAEIKMLREEEMTLRGRNAQLEARVGFLEDSLVSFTTSMSTLMTEFRDSILRSSPLHRDEGPVEHP